MTTELEHSSYDVIVVGAGVAGLMLTKKLAEIGLHTGLVEKNDKLASGPSTRNEGWLHRGTYHANSILDRSTAIQVAKRCIYGHEQIKSFAPEAIEDIDMMSYAITRDSDRVEEITSRWDEAGVPYKGISVADFSEREPNVNVSDVAEVFQVNDLGLNTRLLYRKLLHASQSAGATIMPGTDIQFLSPEEAQVSNATETRGLKAKLFVHTAGYGVKNLIESSFGVPVPLRYWKSHLAILPRLTDSPVFLLDPHEAALMNHGPQSIVGMNEDATITDEPNYDVVNSAAGSLRDAIDRSFLSVKGNLTYVACIKTDLVEKSATARSLSISVSEPLPNHLCVLPGKMTEAPYVTDVVTKIVYSKMNDDIIALRPMDMVEGV